MGNPITCMYSCYFLINNSLPLGNLILPLKGLVSACWYVLPSGVNLGKIQECNFDISILSVITASD